MTMKGYTLITGASGAIGQAVALELAGTDTNLFLHYAYSKEKTVRLKKACEKQGADVSLIQADLSDPKGVGTLIRGLHSPVERLVYACGTAHYELFQHVSQVEMTALMQLHLGSAMQLTQKLLPEMIHRKEGRMVFISSIWGREGAAMEVVYSAAKSGINGFVKALAKETARSGIRANAIAPGVIESDMINHLSEEERGDLENSIAAGRIGKPEEIAKAVQFLLSDHATYIHGHILHADGGW